MPNEVTATPLECLYKWETTTPDSRCFVQPVNGEYQEYDWKMVANTVRRIAYRLEAMQLEKGSRIAILAKNCAEWIMTDLAIMMTGHISVPIFATAGTETIQYVLNHADVKVVFIGKLDDADNQIAAIPEEIKTVAFPYPGIKADEYWAEFLDCPAMTDSPVPNATDLMTIIYTSGSTGHPKGVMHTFDSMSWAGTVGRGDLSLSQQDRLLSYLPLAHITERVLVEMAALHAGMQLFFVESLDTFQRDVQHCKPTLFVSVPRLWTKFQLGILHKLPQKKLDMLLRIPIVSSLIKRKIKAGLGLSEVKICASGSAPIPPSVITWFARLGVEICEGWGMTENSAYGTGSVPFRHDKIGCIGKPYDGVDIRTSEEGEIQVKSPCNMLEYYLEPEKTAEVFTEDGYLRTGDKGVIDADGYVKITGRLKDIFKTAKGKYVTPAPIEAKFMENPIVEQVCVTGTNLPQPVALLVLSEEAHKKDKASIESSLKKTFDAINAKLESHQVMDRVVVMKKEWSIENDLLTPTLKVKRHVLEERFEGIIQGDYSEKLVWVNA